MIAFVGASTARAQQTVHWGNQGDGTYRNPVLAGDFSDPDVIRVGEDFYLISSTINMAPGMAVLHSRDLVSWQIISHVVSDLRVLGPELNWDRMNRYGQGVYAGSLRYHEGTFYVHFTSFLEGLFVATAKDPRGPWNVKPMRDRNGKPLLVSKWLDPCPLWDGDGKSYLVASKNNGVWYPHLFRMSADGSTLLDADAETMARAGAQPSGGGTLIYSRDSAEGNKIYKKDGYYYFFNNEVSWHGRMAIMRRSRYIYGERADGSPGTAAAPGAYQVKPMLKTHAGNREMNQGGLVDTPDGRWYFMTHGGMGGFPDGRVVSLLPVLWVDGWPVTGDDADGDGVGDMVWAAEIPIPGKAIHYPQGSDDFSASELSPRWEWNHQPRSEYWSLSERPGWLRLRAFRPLTENSFFRIGNILGQRYLSAANVQATVELDVSAMARNQKAGLAQFNGGKNHAALRISRDATVWKLEVVVDERVISSHEIKLRSHSLWLRTNVDQPHRARFSYSTNGSSFTELPERADLKWGGYRGAYIGVFTYSDVEESGYLDINSFDYRFDARPMERPEH